MSPQEYLIELVKESEVYVSEKQEAEKKLIVLFKDKGLSEVTEFGDDDFRTYFNCCQIIIDTKIIFQKIASYIAMCKILNLEIDLDIIENNQYLLRFVKEHKPFEVDFIVSPEGSLKEKNLKLSDQKFEMFKQNVNFKDIEDLNGRTD